MRNDKYQMINDKYKVILYWPFSIGHLALQRGFTLMELMIVIALVAILMAVGASSYFASIKTGRDTQRKGDVKQVQKALEEYYADTNEYPNNCSGLQPSYLPQGMPKDPLGSDYIGASLCTTTSYCICAQMDNTTTGNSTNSSCSFATGGGFFCIKNLQ